MLVAHRGFRNPNGENRMVDFEKALKTCKAVEFDIRFTKDNQIIIFHDDDFKRIGNFENKVPRELTYDEIKEIPFFKNNPEWIPPLFKDEFADKIAQFYEMINVEIKEDKYLKYTEKEFDAFKEALDYLRIKTNAEIMVSSFDHDTLEFISTLNPKDFKRAYLLSLPREIDWDLIKKFDYINPSFKMAADPKNLDFFKKVNLPLNIWTFQEDNQVNLIKKLYPPSQIYGWISDNKDLTI